MLRILYNLINAVRVPWMAEFIVSQGDGSNGNRDAKWEELERSLIQEVEKRIQGNAFSASDITNIKERRLDLIRGDLEVSPVQLEKLRRLCQLWEVDISVGKITSHRKVIGPVIVQIKKLLFPMMRFFLKDLIREQRAFNAEVISLLSDIAHTAHAASSRKGDHR